MLAGSLIVALRETTLDWCLVALGKTQLDLASEIVAELLKLSAQPQLCLSKPEPLPTPRGTKLLQFNQQTHRECWN